MRQAAFSLAVLLSGVAEAQESGPSQARKPMDACKVQIELYCKDEGERKDLREVAKCLVRNDENLSTECKQEIQRFAQASRQTTPPGGGPLGALGGLTGAGSQVPSLSYDGRYVPSRAGQTPSFTENNLNVSFPVYKTETDTVSVTINGGNFHLSEPIVMDSGKTVPADFYRTEVGLGYSRKLANHRTIGFRGSYGYAGDKFKDNTQNYNLSANYSFPSSKEGSWVLMVMMSNNSPLGTSVPIPGFFYIYRTPTFTGLFGLPVASMQWTPVNPWSFSFSLFGPQIKTEAAYGAIDETQFFAGFGWKQQRYIVSDRTDDEERLTVEEKTAEIGLRRPLFHGVFSEFQTGYSFDRAVYAGEGLFNTDGGNANLESNWFLKWSLRVAF